MKNIIYGIFSLIFVLSSCSKEMNEIDEQLELMQEKEKTVSEFLRTRPSAPAEYVLTEGDYELSTDADVAKYKNFSKYKLSKDFLPEILYFLFSAEDGQSLKVTYKYYSKPVVDKEASRSVSEEEYTAMGANYGNFSSEDEAEALIGKLLDSKVYAAEAGTEITVDYTLYSTNLERFVQVNSASEAVAVDYSSSAVELSDAQYEALGQGKYKNFYNIDDALSMIPTLALEAGQAYPITYSCKVYKNYVKTYVVYIYDGSNWKVKESVTSVSEELNYSLNKEDISLSYWWADPAIKITLTGDDYAINDYTSKYSNFDLRSGSTPGTDVDLRVQMLGEMLDANHAPIIEGEQYLVTYSYYDGGNGVASDRIIKQNGVWSMYTE